MDSNSLNTQGKIKTLEIDLIDACNLSCPLCNRDSFKSKDGYLPLEKWKQILDKYPSLSTIYFLGTRSEHTLYPYFLELYQYIKKRGLRVVLSTNGCTNKPAWWRELKALTTPEDEVRFAIEGTTQEMYETYRIGGSLERFLLNHEYFKGKGNDWVQYIYFEHNEGEQLDELALLFEGRVRTLHSSYSEQEIRPRASTLGKYRTLNTLVANKDSFSVKCHSHSIKQHFINYKGDISPCCHYNEYKTLKGSRWDMDYGFEHNFCRLVCDTMCVKLRKEWGIEI